MSFCVSYLTCFQIFVKPIYSNVFPQISAASGKTLHSLDSLLGSLDSFIRKSLQPEYSFALVPLHVDPGFAISLLNTLMSIMWTLLHSFLLVMRHYFG